MKTQFSKDYVRFVIGSLAYSASRIDSSEKNKTATMEKKNDLLRRALTAILVLDSNEDEDEREYLTTQTKQTHPITKSNSAIYGYGKLKLSEEMVLHVLSFFGDRNAVIYA